MLLLLTHMAERGDLLKSVPSDECFKTHGDLEITKKAVKGLPHVKRCAFLLAPGAGHELQCSHDLAKSLPRGGSCEYTTIDKK